MVERVSVPASVTLPVAAPRRRAWATSPRTPPPGWPVSSSRAGSTATRRPWSSGTRLPADQRRGRRRRRRGAGAPARRPRVRRRGPGHDEMTDVAVLQWTPRTSRPRCWGQPRRWWLAIRPSWLGAPAGPEGHQVTTGIVSAVSRTVDRGDRSPLYDMIQTDAPTPAAAVGGALLDHTARWSASPSPAGSRRSGLTSATPIDLARRVADDIIETGMRRHVWLGVEGEDLATEGLGPRASKAEPWSGGSRAGARRTRSGLRPDDVIFASPERRSRRWTAWSSPSATTARRHHRGRLHARRRTPDCEPVLVERSGLRESRLGSGQRLRGVTATRSGTTDHQTHRPRFSPGSVRPRPAPWCDG